MFGGNVRKEAVGGSSEFLNYEEKQYGALRRQGQYWGEKGKDYGVAGGKG